jgi:hypothetical protein
MKSAPSFRPVEMDLDTPAIFDRLEPMRSLGIRLKFLLLFFFFAWAFLSGRESFGMPRGPAGVSPSLRRSPFFASFVSNRPKMVFIEALGISYAPESPYNLYLVNRIWYYYYDQKWYKSSSHEGSWRYVSYSKIPDVLHRIPDRYIKKKDLPSQAGAKAPKEKRKKGARPPKR